jgi:TetR/AcrR family transcriptional regulator
MSASLRAPAPTGDTRDAILAVAAAYFAEYGYAYVSLRQIAGACGITPAALYYHFRDKDDLYRCALAVAFSEKIAPIHEIVAGPEPAVVRFKSVFRWYARMVAEDRIFTRLLHREMLDGDDDRIRFMAREVFQAPFGKVVTLIEELIPGSDAECIALSAFSIVLGHFEFESVGRYLFQSDLTELAPEDVGERAAELVLRGAAALAGQ